MAGGLVAGRESWGKWEKETANQKGGMEYRPSGESCHCKHPLHKFGLTSSGVARLTAKPSVLWRSTPHRAPHYLGRRPLASSGFPQARASFGAPPPHFPLCTLHRHGRARSSVLSGPCALVRWVVLVVVPLGCREGREGREGATPRQGAQPGEG